MGTYTGGNVVKLEGTIVLEPARFLALGGSLEQSMISSSFSLSSLFVQICLTNILKGVSDGLLRRELERLRGGSNDDLHVNGRHGDDT